MEQTETAKKEEGYDANHLRAFKRMKDFAEKNQRITPTDLWITKNLISHELAVKIKNIGFDRHCIAFSTEVEHINLTNRAKRKDSINVPNPISVPTYQEVFDWLEEEHKIFCVFEPSMEYDEKNLNYDQSREKVEYKNDGWTWSIYPFFFTENDGYSWFFTSEKVAAKIAAIEKAIEFLNNKNGGEKSH